MKISTFEIDSYGHVTLSVYKDGHNIKHEYHNVPKKIIMKLLQAKTAPDTEDFAKWVKDEQDKHSDNGPVYDDFWHED